MTTHPLDRTLYLSRPSIMKPQQPFPLGDVTSHLKKSWLSVENDFVMLSSRGISTPSARIRALFVSTGGNFPSQAGCSQVLFLPGYRKVTRASIPVLLHCPTGQTSGSRVPPP